MTELALLYDGRDPQLRALAEKGVYNQGLT